MGQPWVVLVVADDLEDCDRVLPLLKEEPDFAVKGPLAALDALRFCLEEPLAAAVIHLETKDISGMELSRLVRGRQGTSRLPIVLFSSRFGGYGAPSDHLGSADAFFARTEFDGLVPKLRSLLESTPEASLAMYCGRSLKVNFERVRVAVDGAVIDLTRQELSLLRFLVTHRNHVLSRRDILVHVWNGENDGQSRTIDTHIRRLRVKLRRAGEQIQTVRGVGYRFNDD